MSDMGTRMSDMGTRMLDMGTRMLDMGIWMSDRYLNVEYHIRRPISNWVSYVS